MNCAACRARQHRILQALGEQGFRQLRQAAQVLCLACSLDARAGLQRSRDAAKSQHISGLVEQVSCPCAPSCLTPLPLEARAVSLGSSHLSDMDCPQVRHVQARGPLSALRTLGAMLVPRTQDVNRDVADGIVVQVGFPCVTYARSPQHLYIPHITPRQRELHCIEVMLHHRCTFIVHSVTCALAAARRGTGCKTWSWSCRWLSSHLLSPRQLGIRLW